MSDAAIDVTKKDWSLVTRTEGGAVNFTRKLTLAEADKIAHSVNFYENMVPGVMYEGHNSNIVQTTILGPEGWDGCRKAPLHKWTEMEPVPSGPCTRDKADIGRLLVHGHCLNCGESYWSWADEWPPFLAKKAIDAALKESP